ncbi:MAG: gluconokinase [Chloroflexi bacterium]|nr:gluconokinase [Chloroflexota bacterium]
MTTFPSPDRTGYVIGLDIGTSGCRAVVFDGECRQLAEAAGEYPHLFPRPGWAEQDPDAIFAAVLKAVRQAVDAAQARPGQVRALGISAIFHGMLAVDAAGNPLTRANTWADTRAGRQAEEARKVVDAQAVYARTGCPIHPMYLPWKIAWLRETEPEVFKKAARFISVKEYIIHRLFGRFVVDLSVASATGLLDTHKLCWDDEMLSLAGIGPERLSEPVEGRTALRGMKQEYVDAMGLLPDTAVVLGAGDGVLSSLGTGTVDAGQMTVMIGTSGAARVMAREPRTDAQGRTWCYYLADGRWVIGAAINNGGLIHQWIQDNFWDWGWLADLRKATGGEPPRPREMMEAWAAEVPPGSEGLIFLPLLTGERAPYWNADARGVLLGLTMAHGRKHILRATLEGVCYRMRSIVDALIDVTGAPVEVRATGGFTHSKLWVQMLADVLGMELQTIRTEQASAFGAAFLAMVSQGMQPDLAAIRSKVEPAEGYAPREAEHALYDRLYKIDIDAYWALQDQFRALAEVRSNAGRVL